MVIRVQARTQPALAGTPSANPNAPNLGDALTDAGAGVFDLGEAVNQIRTAEAAREQELALRRARVDAVKQLTAARARIDESPDPDGLAERFDQEVARIRDEVGGVFEGANREEFELAFDELALNYQAGVIERQVKLGAAVSRDRLESDLGDLLVEYGAAPDELSRDAIADQAAGAIARAQAAGLIGDDQAEAALENFGRQAAQAERLRLLREDPAALVAALEAGAFDLGPVEREQEISRARKAAEARAKAAEGEDAEAARARAIAALAEHPDRLVDEIDAGRFDALPPAERARYRVSALSAIADTAEREVKRAEAAEAERVKAVGEMVANAEAALIEGRRVAGLPELIRAARGTEHEARLDAVIANTAALGGFSRLTPAARAEALEAERARPVSARTEADQERLALMREMDAALRESEERDILTHVAERDLADVPAIDFADPATLSQRRTTALTLAERFEVAPRFFTEAERAGLVRRVESASVEDRLALITTITEGFGADAAAALGEIGFEKPVFAHAGALVALSGQAETARAILAGQEALEAGQVKVPSMRARSAALADLGVAEALPVELSAARSQIVRAADAHFAATAAHLAGSDDPDEIARAYARSLDAAAGAVTVGGVKRGGFQEVNGQMTLLPPTVSAGQAEAALRGATPVDLAGASRTKQEPSFAGETVDRFDAELVPRYVGGGLYMLGVMVGGRFRALADEAEPEGRALFDLAALVDRARARQGGLLGAVEAGDEAIRGLMRGPADRGNRGAGR